MTLRVQSTNPPMKSTTTQMESTTPLVRSSDLDLEDIHFTVPVRVSIGRDTRAIGPDTGAIE